MVTFNTISDIRSTAGTTSYETAHVLGYYTPGDGPLKIYFWDASSAASANGVTIIDPVGGTGRWILISTTSIYNLLDWGVKANGTSFDNHSIVQGLINSIGNTENVVIRWPSASNTYYLSDTLLIENKQIHLLGDNVGTKLLFPAGKVGIHLTRSSPGTTDYSILENLYIQAAGKDANDGKDDEGNPSTNYEEHYHYHGLSIGCVCKIRNVHVHDFSGHGFDLRGSISGYGTNVSFAILESILAQQCHGNGIYIGWDDANGINFINIDMRDNDNYGVYDQSFFGNTFIGGGFHNNDMGHIYISNPIAESCFFGTYFEEGSPASYAAGRVLIHGGYQGSDWVGDNVQVMRGANTEKLYIKKYQGTYKQIGFDKDSNGEPQQIFDGGGGYKFAMRSTDSAHTVTNYTQKFGGDSIPLYDNLWQMVGWGAKYTYRNHIRSIRHAAHGFAHLFVGESFIQCAPDTASLEQMPYFPNDLIRNSAWTPNNPSGWLCVEHGTFGVYGEGCKGTSTGTTDLNLDFPTDRIMPGDRISCAGNVRRIVARTNNNQTLVADSAWPVIGTSSSISFVQPIFKAIGQGAGTTAQRPTLASPDAGWPYFDTTLGKPIWWNGSAWKLSDGTSA